MEAVAAADVLRQYLTTKRWILAKVASGGDDLPVEEAVVAFRMAFPHCAECLDFHHLLQFVFITFCMPDFAPRFVDELLTALETQELESDVHFVKSFLKFRGTGEYVSTSELAQTCQKSVLLHSRLTNSVQAAP